MPITLQVPTVLARHAENASTLQANGRTLGEVVSEVGRRYPALAERLRDAKGDVYPHVNLYVNDEDARFLGGFSTPLRDGDVVTVVPAVAGG
ncbi:MAG: MoaD/ThiS family protein [Gemmatimonadales bacterium]